MGETQEATRQKMEDLRIKGEETKDAAGRKAEETKNAAGRKTEETKNATGEKMEGLREKGGAYKDETGMQSEEAKNAAAQKGSEAKGGIFGTIGSVTGAIKEKLLNPAAASVDETREAAREHGDEVRKPGEIDAEKTRPGVVASDLKASDQMAGQTFNDVGRVRDETTARQGKM